ncbi:MAG: sigma factor [Mycobacteriales bacterium]
MRTTGDADFTAFVSARYRPLVRRARLLTGNADAARDLTQSALERLYPRWRLMREPHAAHQYVERTMVRLLIDRRRRGSVTEVPLVSDDADPQTSADPTAAVDDRLALQQALSGLTPSQRAVLVPSLPTWVEALAP